MATIHDYFNPVLSPVSSRVPLETEVETGSSQSSDSPLNSDSEEDEETEESTTCHIVSPAVDVDCSCPCCSSTSSNSSSVPVQPDRHISHKKRQRKQMRSFQHTCFQEPTWLMYCVLRDRAFCQ